MVVLSQIESKTGNGKYEVRQGNDGVVYCTCPAWRFSKPHDCIHLREMRGEEKK